MKKIYSLFMALSFVLCAMANSPYVVENQLAVSTPKVVKKLNFADVATHKVAKQAKFNQQDREAIAAKRMAKATPALQVNGARQINAVQAVAKQAMLANAVRKAPAKAAAEIVAKDTVEFVAAVWNYQYYEDTGDWWMAVGDSASKYRFDFDYVVPIENFAGTYSIEDLDLSYSYFRIYDAEGDVTYFDYVTADFTVTDNEEGKSLVANVLGSDSIRYLFSAVELPLPDPKGEMTLAYANATLEDATATSKAFQFWGDENGYYTSIFMVANQVEGTYTKKDMYDAYYNYIMHVEGEDTTFIDFLDINAVITKEDRTYNLVADALGTDTIMYHISMSYTKPAPVDTVDIVATNLFIDEFEFLGYTFVTITASNEEYAVGFDMSQALVAGEYTTGDFNASYSTITRLSDMVEIGMAEITATVTGEGKDRAIQAQVVGTDTILYNMDLSYTIPEITDTVEIVFDSPATASYYESMGDYYIKNYSKDYIVYLDIFEEKNMLGGEYTAEDFDLSYTFVCPIVDGDTSDIVIMDAKATITLVSEGLGRIEAELTGQNAVLYKVSTDVELPYVGLQYDEKSGSVERNYDLSDIMEINTANFATSGYVMLNVVDGKMADQMQVRFFLNDTVEGTIIPEGTYPINETQEAGTVLASVGYVTGYGAQPSFYSTLIEQDGTLYLDKMYFMVSGNVVVENVDGHIKVSIEAVNSYEVPINIVYEAVEGEDDGDEVTPLQYDATEGSIDDSYTTADDVTISAGSGYSQVLAYAADGTDMMGMVIFHEADENTIIPVGTYEINASQANGTVMASSGVNAMGQVTLSFYGLTNAQGQITPPCYFFVGGSVEVSAADGVLKMEVNAVNSYNVPIHIVCEYDLNTKQGMEYDAQEGEINKTYSDADLVEITDYVAQYGQIYIDITAADGSNTISVAFNVNNVDAVITIPAGVYPINDSGAPGTVYASPGVVDGYVYASFYANLSATGGISIPYYFMVSGQVTVENIEGHLKMTINAFNSYEVPINITYEADPVTGVVNINTTTTGASKMIENDQLLIIKDGVRYNVMGSVVK